MKFTIITHAEHKLTNQEIFAYEPYVREMNLWLKCVDKVLIVAPISKEEVTSIESKYQFNLNKCHPEQDCAERSRSIEGYEIQLGTKNLRQAQTDNLEHHSQQVIERSRNVDCKSHKKEQNKQIKLIKIPAFDLTTLKNGVKAVFKIPKIVINIYKAMRWANHIHLRCPGNIGLLGCFVQIAFPNKPKTIKYAGNWDPKSKQPLSYQLQKWILNTTFLTKNAKVLVYGEWKNQSKNIVPFFTATYSENECHPEPVEGFYNAKEKADSLRQACTEHSRSAQTDNLERHLYQDTERSRSVNWESHNSYINFIFVGALTKGKQPLLSVQVIHQLKQKEYNVQLNIYGEGEERKKIEAYIQTRQLQNSIILHGNKSKKTIKKAYQNAHFLLFISKSEGWPKVVAEAMFWGCLPISSSVSCIPYMLDNGNRGAIVTANTTEIVLVIEKYLKNKIKYQEQIKKAMDWSRKFTLEKFEMEIKKLVHPHLIQK